MDKNAVKNAWKCSCGTEMLRLTVLECTKCDKPKAGGKSSLKKPWDLICIYCRWELKWTFVIYKSIEICIQVYQESLTIILSICKSIIWFIMNIIWNFEASCQMPPKMRVKVRFFVINFLCPIKHSHAFIVTETVKLIHMYFSVEGIVVKIISSKKYVTFSKFDQHYGRLVGI